MDASDNVIEFVIDLLVFLTFVMFYFYIFLYRIINDELKFNRSENLYSTMEKISNSVFNTIFKHMVYIGVGGALIAFIVHLVNFYF
ncbi:MAG: hypothetical protein U1E82_10975 [Nitrosomonas sp.]